jgi:hypothetical protein
VVEPDQGAVQEAKRLSTAQLTDSKDFGNKDNTFGGYTPSERVIVFSIGLPLT